MAAVCIRKLDEDVIERLRIRAAQHGRSMEAELREILVDAASEREDEPDLFTTIVDRFSAVGGVELDLPVRSTQMRGPRFAP